MMSERTRRLYEGYRTTSADLVKELVIACAAVFVLVLILAAAFSSPDPAPLTAKAWSTSHPVEMEQEGLMILNGQNDIASYGPPYDNQMQNAQTLGPIAPQVWAGVTIPIDAKKVFVLDPLRAMEPIDPSITPLLAAFESASPAQQAAWEKAYQGALTRARVVGGEVLTPNVDAGPVPGLLTAWLNLARTGSLEAVINESGRIYQTDFTRALLLLQGYPLQSVAANQALLGTQWGMMKEPGNWPGAVWLWFYTLLYQIPPYSTSPAGDLLVGITVGVGTLLFLLVPWIPGLRDIPRAIPIHRAIWRGVKRHGED